MFCAYKKTIAVIVYLEAESLGESKTIYHSQWGNTMNQRINGYGNLHDYHPALCDHFNLLKWIRSTDNRNYEALYIYKTAEHLKVLFSEYYEHAEWSEPEL